MIDSKTTVSSSGSSEAQLRAEIEELRKRLAAQERGHAHGHPRKRPAAGTLLFLAMSIVLLIVAAFFAGWLPHRDRQRSLVAEARSDSEAVPVVNAPWSSARPAKANWCCRVMFRRSRRRLSWRVPTDTSSGAWWISGTG